MDRLKDKISIVTGAAHGIGKAIAECFAEEGAWVLVVDIDEEFGENTAEEIRQKGGQAVFYHCDVGNPEAVLKTAKQAAVETGRIDILCNNAAYIARWHDALEVTEEEWDRCVAVTLMGTANSIKGVLPYMIQQQSGNILNISSIQGVVGARGSAAYSSVKHGIIGLTRSVAYDFGPKNVRCNAICPGPISVRYSPKPGDELYQRQISKTMMGRVGQPREVGLAAVFLASDEASYITGAVLPVDGGWTAI
jgi:NAD(P)-dependent dehydrogenase (short-subunit alcohol dehydrogenase family)